MDEHFFIYNDNFYQVDTVVTGTKDRSWMYGDGLFETMRVQNGLIINRNLHFERFYKGLDLLKFPYSKELSENFFVLKIKDLLQKNNLQNQARVRLMAFRQNPLQERNTGNFNYLLEAWPMAKTSGLITPGLTIDLSHDARKCCDPFSNLKSNNYLSSVMAMIAAREKGVDECLVLNSANRICESAIANIFLVKEGRIFTPPLSEGCVAGVVRRWLIENLPQNEFLLEEKKISEDDLMNADEVFLTNSIRPVRWVETFRERSYQNELTTRIAELIDQKME